MINAVIILFILVCGSDYVTYSVKRRFYYKRLEGWDAYLFIAKWGVIFLLIGGGLLFLISQWDRQYTIFPPHATLENSLFIQLMTLLIVFLLALGIARSYALFENYRFSADKRWELLQKTVLKQGNVLDNLLLQSYSANVPIIATLKSRKVYIGILADHFDIEDIRSNYFEIIPYLSGYREQLTHNLFITTNYVRIYEKLA